MLPLLAALLGCPAPPEEPAGPPNVLLVTLDTTRADRLEPYGFGLAQTPVLSRLAAEGAVLEHTSTTAPITLPAHISIQTGRIPPVHGVRDNGSYALSEEAVTLAEVLTERGYESRAWVSAAVLDSTYNLDQGFASYDDELWDQDAPPLFMIRERPGATTSARVVEWLEARPEDAPPFFAWVHYFDAHQPHTPKHRDMVLAPTPYDGEIAGMDRALGQVIGALEARDELDDTLVVVVGDHGESLGEHGEQTHAVFIYDATVHVPLIVRWPARVAAGTRVAEPTSVVDIFPTVLSLVGADPVETDGRDLSAALTGGTVPARDLYFESLLAERGFGMAPLHGVRRGDEVYIRAPRPERYNTSTDPGQLDDLIGQDPARDAELDGALQALLDAAAAQALPVAESPLSEQSAELLMAMGYLASPADQAAVAGMDPKDGLPLHNLLEDARHAVRAHRFQQADAAFAELLQATPGNVSARNTFAYSLAQRGRLEEARAEYRSSLESDPRQYRVYAQLGRIAWQLDEPELARERLEQALEITPDFVEAMVQLGVIAYLQGDAEEAERWHQRALEVDPSSARVWRDIADLRYREERWADALAGYERVIEVNPRDYQAQLHAGAAALAAGDVDRSVAHTQAAAELRPDSWMPPYNLACAEAGRDPSAALGYLGTAADRGLRDAALLEADPDLAPLRAQDGWAALVERVRASSSTP